MWHAKQLYARHVSIEKCLPKGRCKHALHTQKRRVLSVVLRFSKLTSAKYTARINANGGIKKLQNAKETKSRRKYDLTRSASERKRRRARWLQRHARNVEMFLGLFMKKSCIAREGASGWRTMNENVSAMLNCR
jgi:hypothetical protein